VFSANGETPLHAVARRGDVATARMLVEQGADLSRRRADGRTPYALAVLGGNQAVADWLSQKGGADILQPVDRLIAACGRGDRATAKAMLAAQPALRGQIGPEHYAALHRAAEQGAADAVEALLACGLDPDHGDDEIGKTALHSAAMGGQVETVRVLLAHGASVAVRDREFAAQPLVWAADGIRSHRGMGVNHAEVARLLLEAGSPMDWKPPGKEPSAAIIDVIESWVREFRNRPE
jgi:ankyrin repeat protein